MNGYKQESDDEVNPQHIQNTKLKKGIMWIVCDVEKHKSNRANERWGITPRWMIGESPLELNAQDKTIVATWMEHPR